MVSFMDNIGAAPDHVMSIDDIKFPDNSFDVIIAIGILLLVPDDAKAIRELHRTLKPGGYAVLEDPIKSGPTEEYDLSTPEAKAASRQKYGHLQYRYYGENEYHKRIAEFGFDVVRSEYAQELDRHRYGLGGHRYVHIAYKR
ncbi:MAG: methyltransferase domain-containing protein [Cytophagales bacterium]|nr:methyltransferase domain-containing protein [Cytophagales bacterium]